MSVTVHHGDSREVLKTLADASIDSVVCDPPYALVSIGKRFGAEGAATAKSGKTGVYARASAGFMGQRWDTGETAFAVEFWAEVMRVLKPGGHVVAFSGTRTYHRLACAIEDAGFELRDMLQWLYGSGFPKSHDVSKGIDRGERGRLVRAKLLHFSEARGITGAWLEERGVASAASFRDWTVGGHVPGDANWKIVAAALEVTPAEEAQFEREVVARGHNGIAGGTGQHAGQSHAYGFKETYELTTSATDAARQWAGWGTALKPACEPIVLARKPLSGTVAANVVEHGTGAINVDGCRIEGGEAQGRWPANIAHDGSDEVLALFPDTSSGGYPPEGGMRSHGSTFGVPNARGEQRFTGSDGSAARFFYTAKADATDRLGSKHPTVKPTDLMRWLCRLVTPPGGLILDPFAGSGSTGVAAIAEGFDAVLIEREAEYVADIRRRIAWAQGEGRLTAQEKAKTPARQVDDLPLFGGEAA